MARRGESSTRSLLIAGMQRAGKVAADALREARRAARPGESTLALETAAAAVFAARGMHSPWKARHGHLLSVGLDGELFGYAPGGKRIAAGSMVTVFVAAQAPEEGSRPVVKATSFLVGEGRAEARRVARGTRRALHRAISQARTSTCEGDLSYAMMRSFVEAGIDPAISVLSKGKDRIAPGLDLIVPGAMTGSGRSLWARPSFLILATAARGGLAVKASKKGFPLRMRSADGHPAAAFAHSIVLEGNDVFVLTHDPEDEFDEESLAEGEGRGPRRFYLTGVEKLVDHHLGGLFHGRIGGTGEAEGRVTTWHRTATHLGFDLPLYAVRDVGFFFAMGPDTVSFRPLPGEVRPEGEDSYRRILEAVRDHPVVARIARDEPDDLAVALLVTRLLRPLAERYAERVELAYDFDPVLLYRNLSRRLPWEEAAVRDAWTRARPPGPDEFFDEELSGQVTANLDGLSYESFRFMQSFLGAGQLDYGALMDLFQILDLPDGTAIIEDAMSMIPDFSRPGRSRSEQYATIDGFRGLSHRGSFDALVPSELAYPREAFLQRFVDGELLFFSHERPPLPKKNLFWLLCQAGMAMKGDADLLARALTVALSRRLADGGLEFRVSFFDGELGESFPLVEPKDYYRVLTRRGAGALRLGRVLDQVGERLAREAPEYHTMRCLFLLHVHADEFGEHGAAWRGLRQWAETSAVLVGSEVFRDDPSPLRSCFPRSHFIPYEVLADIERRRQDARSVVLSIG